MHVIIGLLSLLGTFLVLFCCCITLYELYEDGYKNG